MATIEERAKEKYPQNDRVSKRLIESYISIAKEQRQIDIDRSKIFIESAFPNSPLVLQAYLEFMNN